MARTTPSAARPHAASPGAPAHPEVRDRDPGRHSGRHSGASPAAARPGDSAGASGPALPPAARRALAEAETRRGAAAGSPRPAELGGRDGPEPVRYGDWERKGLAIDF